MRVALDVYEGAGPLSAVEVEGAGFMVAALGSERGWNAAEREVLRAQGFCLAHLGPRVLRTETAAVAAGAILLSKAGWL